MLSAEEYEYYDCGAVAASCQGDCCGDTRQEEDEKGEDDRWNRGFHQESDKSMKKSEVCEMHSSDFFHVYYSYYYFTISSSSTVKMRAE